MTQNSKDAIYEVYYGALGNIIFLKRIHQTMCNLKVKVEKIGIELIPKK